MSSVSLTLKALSPFRIIHLSHLEISAEKVGPNLGR